MSKTQELSKENEAFETKLENAKETLETLMNPEITLQNSVKAYEKGMKELADAGKILEDAVIKINEIKNS
jgi:exodeoxyribonuclease VII small subunit